MNTNKLYELEALRGIASIIVFFSHFSLGFIPVLHGLFVSGKGLYGTPFYFIINGGASVTFFFVLSGFVLTYRFFLSRDISYITKGVTKRYFRLLGPVFLIILISYLLFKLKFYYYIEAAVFTKSLWLDDFAFSGKGHTLIPSFKNAIKQGLLTCLFKGDSYYNTNLWTLRIELIGSFISFLLAPVIANLTRNQFIIVLPVILLLLHLINPYYVCFVFGTLIAFYKSKRDIQFQNPLIKLSLITAALLLFSFQKPIGFYSFLMFDNPYFPEGVLKTYIHTLAAVLIILLALSGGRFISLLKGKKGKLLGEISFPLYLVHTIVICSFSSYAYLRILRFFPDNTTATIVTFILTLPVIAAATYIFYRFDKFWILKVNSLTDKL